jgi:ribosomal protein S18 acetylase RimI-like enzyme
MDTHISIMLDDPHGEAAAQFMRKLAEEESQRYRDLGPDDADSFRPEQVLVPRSAFVVARFDGQPVGCGALRPLDSESAEIKRMYVLPSARRRGIGREMVGKLERLAAEFGYRFIRLETGNRQPEAIALYERCGFCRIPLYGEHIGDPVSVCFEKKTAWPTNVAP